MSPPDGGTSDRDAGEARSHRLVVDRFEGDLVVVEVDGGTMLDLPRWMLPPGVREGDVVSVRAAVSEAGGRRLDLETDSAATEEARGEVQALLARLRARDPGGDIAL